MRFNILFIFTTLWSIQLMAQDNVKNTIGAGGIIGTGRVNETFPYTFGYGLKLDYQLNINRWFSLRTDLGYTTNLTSTDYFNNALGEPTEYSSKPSALSLSVAPILYGRFSKINTFVGISFGVAQVWSEFNYSTKTFDSNNNPIIKSTELPNLNEFAIGFTPTIGIGIPISKKRKQIGEIECAISRPLWVEKLYLFQDKPENRYLAYTMYNLQITYRLYLN
jgi:hypothetical protein